MEFWAVRHWIDGTDTDNHSVSSYFPAIDVSGPHLAFQAEHVLLHLGVAEWLDDAAAISSKEVVGHVGVEVEILVVADEVPRLGRHLELLVVPVDHTDAVRLAVGQITRQV